MSFLCIELKQLACTKTESSVLAKGAKTDKFADSKPTKKQNGTQKVGIVSLGVLFKDPKERLRFDRVVEAGRVPECVGKYWTYLIRFVIELLFCACMCTFCHPASTTLSNLNLSFGSLKSTPRLTIPTFWVPFCFLVGLESANL